MPMDLSRTDNRGSRTVVVVIKWIRKKLRMLLVNMRV
jgi:hypothetical protein